MRSRRLHHGLIRPDPGTLMGCPLLRRHRLPRCRLVSRGPWANGPLGPRPIPRLSRPYPARALARVASRAARLTVFPVCGPIRYRSTYMSEILKMHPSINSAIKYPPASPPCELHHQRDNFSSGLVPPPTSPGRWRSTQVMANGLCVDL